MRHIPDDRRYMTYEERAKDDPRYVVTGTTPRMERVYREAATEARMLARRARKEGRTADYEKHLAELRRVEARLTDGGSR